MAIAEDTLRIISIEHIGEQFTQHVLKTRYTPCKIQVHPETNFLVVLEKDHQSHSIEELNKIKEDVFNKTNDQEYLDAEWSDLGSYPRT